MSIATAPSSTREGPAAPPAPLAFVMPTRRALALSLILLPIITVTALALAELWHLSLLLALLPLVLIALDALSLRRMGMPRCIVDAPSLVYMGKPDPIRLTLVSRAGRPQRVVVTVDVDGVLAPIDTLTIDLGPGETVERSYDPTPLERGQAQLTALWLERRGPLGLAAHVTRRPLGDRVHVMPDVRQIVEGEIAILLRRVERGDRRLNSLGDGSEFDALREHRPGFDNRWIDWKQSARHNLLVSREFVDEQNTTVIMGFDCGVLMCERIGGVPRLDHAINAALPLAWLSLHMGDLIGAFSFAGQPGLWVPPSRGRSRFQPFQLQLAGLDYHPEQTNFTLGLSTLEGRLDRRALVILFTDFVDTVSAEYMLEDVARLVRRHRVLFVALRDDSLARMAGADPVDAQAMAQAVLARDLLRERRAVLQRLVRLGVETVDASVDQVTPQLINSYMAIKARGTV